MALLAACGIAALIHRLVAERPAAVREPPRPGPTRIAADAFRWLFGYPAADPLRWAFGDTAPESIHGVVLRRGVPVAGARVQLRSVRSQLEATAARETRTDHLGRFSFAGVDPTWNAVRASIDNQEDVAWFDPSDRTYRSDRVVLSLQPCRRIHARVVDDAGRGLAGVPISRLVSADEPYRPVAVSIEVGRSGAGGAFSACVGDTNTVIGGGDFESVDLLEYLDGDRVTLYPQGTLTGTVRDRRGRPVPGVWMRLDLRTVDRGPIDPVVTDARGRWTAKVPPACRSLRVHWRGQDFTSPDVCVAAGRVGVLDLTVADCDRRVAGVVRVGSGSAAGITVRDQLFATRITDADGRFDFGCPAQTLYWVDGFLARPGLQTDPRDPGVALDLVPGCFVTGRVRRRGRPVAGARMELEGPRQGTFLQGLPSVFLSAELRSQEQRTWLDGTYERLLPPGSYDVNVSDPDGGWSDQFTIEVPRCTTMVRDVSLPDGDEVDGDVPLALYIPPGKGAAISGVVLDAAGLPVPYTRIAERGGYGPATATHRDGTFALAGFALDTAELTYWSADGSQQCDVDVPVEELARPVTLRIGAPSARCRPAPPGGEPVGGPCGNGRRFWW